MPNWTTPQTWADQNVVTASQLNAEIRDNPQYVYNLASAAPYKMAIQRQGGSSGSWQTAGTNNYTNTDAFIQSGVASLSFTAATWTGLNYFTLPITLSGSGQALVFVCPESGAAQVAGIHFYGYINGTNQIVIVGYTGGGIVTTTISVQWVVIGR